MVAELARDTTRKVCSETEKQQNQAETTHSNAKSQLEEEIGILKKQLQDAEAESKEKEQETRKVGNINASLCCLIMLAIVLSFF